MVRMITQLLQMLALLAFLGLCRLYVSWQLACWGEACRRRRLR